MQVVILCGGLGTRLREETQFIPKPMVEVGERPILWHIMKHYSVYGMNEFILALGYKGDHIKEYFYHYEFMNSDVTMELGIPRRPVVHNSHDEQAWRVTLANTGLNTLKGGRLKRVERYVTGENFMLTYGDGVSNVDLDKLYEFHRNHGRIATVTGIVPSSQFGVLRVEKSRVVSFKEKPAESNDFVSGGFFVFNRKIFDYLTADEKCDLEVGPLEKLAQEGQMMIYQHRGYWSCMDTQRDRDHLNSLWTTGKAPWKTW